MIPGTNVTIEDKSGYTGNIRSKPTNEKIFVAPSTTVTFENTTEYPEEAFSDEVIIARAFFNFEPTDKKEECIVPYITHSELKKRIESRLRKDDERG